MMLKDKLELPPHLPARLQKYIVAQDYEKYTAVDQAVWRYILRQLKSFMAKNAHQSYLEGLEKTGIEIEQIPRIEDISARLEKFGWRALPVSGFIPPMAFMELQSLSILPIAADMRSIEHILYTPAPDIVHEAAGHAPILAVLEYAEYLKKYTQIAIKAIFSKEDLSLYKAIRDLSDIKENPNSTAPEIKAAEDYLSKVSKAISFVSEAAELARMNWWTTEYGLIGELGSAKIFGAGLLSSLGEAKLCLSDKVKRIPLTIECIKQSYDITEPQPQLYVAKDFKQLSEVLADFTQTMSYKVGGAKGLECARKAESVNTVEFENKLQISGVLKKYYLAANSQVVAYLQFAGPTQLCYDNKEIAGHGKQYHQQGYGTAVGEMLNFNIKNLKINEITELNYKSGVKISGKLVHILSLSEKTSEAAFILSFAKATAVYENEKLFLPEWGTYDIIIAKSVTSVFSGPADADKFGETDDFLVAKLSVPIYSDEQKKIFFFYQEVRDLRKSGKATANDIAVLFNTFKVCAFSEWLLFLELAEISIKLNLNYQNIEEHLLALPQKNLVEDGLRLARICRN